MPVTYVDIVHLLPVERPLAEQRGVNAVLILIYIVSSVEKVFKVTIRAMISQPGAHVQLFVERCRILRPRLIIRAIIHVTPVVNISQCRRPCVVVTVCHVIIPKTGSQLHCLVDLPIHLRLYRNQVHVCILVCRFGIAIVVIILIVLVLVLAVFDE